MVLKLRFYIGAIIPTTGSIIRIYRSCWGFQSLQLFLEILRWCVWRRHSGKYAGNYLRVFYQVSMATTTIKEKTERCFMKVADQATWYSITNASSSSVFMSRPDGCMETACIPFTKVSDDHRLETGSVSLDMPAKQNLLISPNVLWTQHLQYSNGSCWLESWTRFLAHIPKTTPSETEVVCAIFFLRLKALWIQHPSLRPKAPNLKHLRDIGLHYVPLKKSKK